MKRTMGVAALTVGLAMLAAHSLNADVRSDEKSLVKFEGMLGKVVNIFGGKSAREGVKTSVAVKGDRKVSLNDTTGQIVDLREEKVYDLDIKKKTYKVTTFAEMRQQLEEAKHRAAEEAKKAQAEAPAQKPAAATGKPQQNEPQFDIDFDLKETGQKKNINGFDTREIVMTITMREKGKTLDESGGMMLTSNIWMGPQIPAMKEVVDFDIRYAKAIAGPIVGGASADEMASAMAMYPMMKDALARMKAENVKMDGTPIQTVTTMDAVKSAEQLAAEQRAQQDSSSSSSQPKGIGGLIGGLAARRARGNAAPAAESSHVTVMTITNEIVKVSTSVADAELAVPAGFKEAR
jgi:sRNA-binding protein